MIIDSHCHLNQLYETDQDLCKILKDAFDSGVESIISVCTNFEEIDDIKTIANSFEQVYYTVGVHPTEVKGYQPKDPERITEQINNRKCVAIGETGLDYYNNTISRKQQQKKFATHLEAARLVKKPVVIHTRQAKNDTLDIIRNITSGECEGVFHCFTEDWDMAKKVLNMGFYISFSGIVTFKNAHAIQEVAKKIPRDKILIETDSPWLAPVPHRGKKNYPKHVCEVAKFLSHLRGEDFTAFCESTYRNTKHLFSI